MTKPRWQYSLRTLLAVMAVVAVVVTVAVRVPPVFRVISGVVLFLLAVIQALEFATSERRPLLAAFSWLLFGLTFLSIGLLVWSSALFFGGELWKEEIAFLMLMSGCSLICLFQAGKALLAIRNRNLAERS